MDYVLNVHHLTYDNLLKKFKDMGKKNEENKTNLIMTLQFKTLLAN